MRTRQSFGRLTPKAEFSLRVPVMSISSKIFYLNNLQKHYFKFVQITSNLVSPKQILT